MSRENVERIRREWKENDEGRWYEDNSEAWYEEYGYTWYPSDMGLWIDGEYYWFDSDGYLDPDITSPEEAARIISNPGIRIR